MRLAALLNSPALSSAQRWQLVSSLYDQVRSFIEGSVALLATLAICAWYTDWPGYAWLAGATAVVTSMRLLHWRWFGRARGAGGPHARSPEAWAWDYTAGICTMAALWAATVVCVTFHSHDMQLLLFVLLIQNAWLAGAGIRNAASPTAVLGQTLVTVLPSVVCLAYGSTTLVRMLAPGCFIFILIMLKIARFYGTQTLSLMESEQRLAAANAQLLQLSSTDGLTGLANRRAFDERLAADWAMAVREQLNIAVVIVDVDYFKLYNDYYGHLAGDDCLRATASHIAAAVQRAADLPARYGGEEFIILLPGTTEYGAAEIADRARQAVQAANLPHAASPLGRVTISLGAASMAPTLADLPTTLITRADQALYRAKQAGRNQLCVAALGTHAPAERQKAEERKVVLF